jgi:hypothetical protein
MKRSKALALRALIEKAAVSLSDTDALDGVELFPAWAVGLSYTAGERLRYGDKLYRVLQAHTSQADWTPDSTPSLYAEVEKPGQGDTPDDPIPYSGNMELFEGKYYSQDGVTYRCTRSTGIPVYNDLKDLVGLYVEVVSE